MATGGHAARVQTRSRPFPLRSLTSDTFRGSASCISPGTLATHSRAFGNEKKVTGKKQGRAAAMRRGRPSARAGAPPSLQPSWREGGTQVKAPPRPSPCHVWTCLRGQTASLPAEPWLWGTETWAGAQGLRGDFLSPPFSLVRWAAHLLLPLRVGVRTDCRGARTATGGSWARSTCVGSP